MFKLSHVIACAFGVSVFFSGTSQADTFEVTIYNTTAGQVLTPPITFIHNSNISLFQLGHAAPAHLLPLAEDGDTSGYAGVDSLADVSALHMANAPVMPGHSLTFNIDASTDFPLITIAGMFASTNDAFVSIHDQKLDFGFDKNTYQATVYDAGSERNSEDCQFIPGPPCGNGGVRDTSGAEGFVHVHSGIHGISSLEEQTHSWQYPGAVVTIKRIQ